MKIKIIVINKYINKHLFSSLLFLYNHFIQLTAQVTIPSSTPKPQKPKKEKKNNQTHSYSFTKANNYGLSRHSPSR